MVAGVRCAGRLTFALPRTGVSKLLELCAATAEESFQDGHVVDAEGQAAYEVGGGEDTQQGGDVEEFAERASGEPFEGEGPLGEE